MKEQEDNKQEIEVKDSGIGDHSELQMDPQTAKELDKLENQLGIRPDFVHRGKPGFFTKSEDEWFRNMKASRRRLRFSSDSKVAQFLRKHPGQDFYVRNPNKKKDFMYPVNRRKR